MVNVDMYVFSKRPIEFRNERNSTWDQYYYIISQYFNWQQLFWLHNDSSCERKSYDDFPKIIATEAMPAHSDTMRMAYRLG